MRCIRRYQLPDQTLKPTVLILANNHTNKLYLLYAYDWFDNQFNLGVNHCAEVASLSIFVVRIVLSELIELVYLFLDVH